MGFGSWFGDCAQREIMAVTPTRVINLKGPFFPQSFLPAPLPGAWEQLGMVQFMGTCSCQAVQSFGPWPLAWTWFGFVWSLCGLVYAPVAAAPDPRRGHQLPACRWDSCSHSPGLGAPGQPVLIQLLGFLWYSEHSCSPRQDISFVCSDFLGGLKFTSSRYR